MDERPDPKFKVGQIVAMKDMKKQPIFKILKVMWDDGWFYAWNRKNFAAEHMLRELSTDEKGS